MTTLRSICICGTIVLFGAGMHQADAGGAQNAEALYAQRIARAKPSTAKEWLNLAKWCEQKLLWSRAEFAYRRAVRLDPDLAAEALYAVAQIHLLHLKNSEYAANVLEELLRKQPDDAPALKMQERIVQRDKRSAGESYSAMIEAYKNEKYWEASDALDQLTRVTTYAERSQLEDKLKAAVGKDWSTFIASVRFRRRCKHCTEGRRNCLKCGGRGWTYDAQSRQSPLLSENVRTGFTKRDLFHLRQLCPRCEGTGQSICKHCGGSWLDLGKLTDDQASLVARGLASRAKKALDKVERDKREETEDGWWTLFRALKYYEKAKRLDAETAKDASKDLDEDMKDWRKQQAKSRKKLIRARKKKLEK